VDEVRLTERLDSGPVAVILEADEVKHGVPGSIHEKDFATDNVEIDLVTLARLAQCVT
jgi:hypothetical protein